MYMPPSPMRANPKNAQAAGLAADDEEKLQAKPPVVPTTNMAPAARAATYTPSQTISQVTAPQARSTSTATAVPTGGARTSSPTYGSSEDAENALMNNQVRGNAAPQIKAITDLEQNQVGQGQRDLNARLGAAGFGTSGYLGAASENMRADAARQAAMDIANAQRQADSDARSSVQAGLSGQFQERQEQRADEALRQQLSAAEAMSRPGFVDTNGDGKDDNTGLSTADYDKSQNIAPTDGRQHVPLDGGYGINTEGSPKNPYALQPNELQEVQRLGWKTMTSYANGQPVTVYQDPKSGKWFVDTNAGWNY